MTLCWPYRSLRIYFQSFSKEKKHAPHAGAMMAPPRGVHVVLLLVVGHTRPDEMQKWRGGVDALRQNGCLKRGVKCEVRHSFIFNLFNVRKAVPITTRTH